MAYIVGIDPGQMGAFTFLDIEEQDIYIERVPFYEKKINGKARKVLDQNQMADLFREYQDEVLMVYLEAVNAMPHDGPVQAFKFGEGFGMIKGIIGAFQVPLTLVRPAVWKKVLKVPADKEVCRGRASELMPKCSHLWKWKKDDGLAESALIALYGFSDQGYKITKPITPMED